MDPICKTWVILQDMTGLHDIDRLRRYSLAWVECSD
jgi:hypothetical protein